MAKITVETAAKRLGMDPESCLKRLQEMGMLVRDQLDQIDLDTFQQVKARLDEEKLRPHTDDSLTSKRIGSRVIRRRRVRKEAVEEPVEKATEAIPEEEPAVEAAPVEAAPEKAEEIAALTETEAEIAAEPEASLEDEAEEAIEAAEEIVDETVSDEAIEEEEEEEAEKPKKGRKGKGGKKRDLADVKPKKVRLHDKTHEPAKVLSRPSVPLEPLKPSAAERGAPPSRTRREEERAAPGAADAGAGRGRKGRRVVDFGQQRSRRKDQEREIGFMRNRRQKKKKGAKTEITTPKAIKRKIKVADTIQVGELAKRMGVKSGDLIKQLMSMGMMVTIVQDIDYETAVILATEFGFEVESATIEAEDILKTEEAKPEEMEDRPPVVTVMGHVDHGKTTVLDAIRATDVASGEAGGITQHIGSYSVTLSNGRQITFVDTPGHESFAAMRARGAEVTDIVILVVAADDGVMPQTIESIKHAKEADVPIVVAVNKIDKENADPDKIKNQLMEHELVSEEFGGETLITEISAKKNIGIDDLLENVLLQAEMMELQAAPNKPAVAVILDARLERGRGPVADVIVKEGTLKKGDQIVADTFFGRVRMMFDDRGNEMAEVLPGMPVQVIGLNGVPRAGSILNVVGDEKTSKTVAELRSNQARSEEQKKRASVRLEDLYAQIQEGETQELKILLKGDVQGSVEAVRESLEKIGNDNVKVRVIYSGVGTITETDVNFASASEALVIGFNVRPEVKVKDLSEQQHVQIKLYNVIYELIEDVTAAIVGMLEPEIEEVLNGVAEVRDTFHIKRIGTVAGCYVLEGKILRNSKVRLVRDGTVVYTGQLGSLKRFKDDAKEVQSGFECGMNIDGFNDIKLGDRIESFSLIEVKPTL